MNGLDVLTDILRTITFFLDDKVYGLIPTIYGLFMNLSQIDLLSGEDNPISALISRIYVLLGIFMLFRLAFSLLQYMVDPNSFSDSAKGFGKLVTNSLVSLGLLVLTPWIFSTAMEIQSTIINQNVIPSLVLGSGITSGDAGTSTNSGTVMSADFVQEIAKDTQFMMFGAFYYVNGNVVSECAETPVFGTIGMSTNESCLETLDEGFASEEAIYSSNVQLSSFFKTADENGNVTDNRNFTHFDKLLWWKINGEYVINYIPFISTIAGIYVVFLLITFCVDVAVRILKLAFLQAVAPIAIISYVDPKESLSNSKLSNWLKETGKTYFSLFLRLAMIYLILLLISAIANTVLSNGSPIQNSISDSSYTMWVYLFLVIASFMFAKKVPELLEKIFGIKGSGEFSLNPFKTIKDVATIPAIAAGGAALGAGVGAMASNTIAAYSTVKNNWGNNINDFKNNFSTAKGVAGKMGVIKSAASPWLGIGGGAISGAIRGGRAGYTGKNMIQGAIAGRKASNQARYRRDVNQEANYGVKQRVFDKVSDFAGIKNKDAGLGKMDKDIKILKKQMSDLDMQESGVREQMAGYYKQYNRDMLDDAVKAKTYEEYLKSQNINIPVSQSVTMGNTNVGNVEQQFNVSAENVGVTGGARSNVNEDIDNRVPKVMQDVVPERNVANLGDISGQPSFNSNQQSQQVIEIPSVIIDEKTFNEYKNLSDTVESINNQREDLRQQVSRYEDVSEVKKLNKKG